MKKIFLFFFLIIATKGIYAQTINYGIKAGFNLFEFPSTLYFPTSGGLLKTPLNNSYKAGFHIGGLVDIEFKSFTIQPGILFTTKGGKAAYTINDTFDGKAVTDQEKSSATFNYIEVPFNFLYRLKTQNGSVFMGGGPYAGIGISGSGTGYSNINGTQTNYPTSIKFGAGGFKNPDIGINALVGYRLNSGVMESIGYGHGITDLRQLGSGRNEGFSLSVGYFFK